jgi:hypothetical protein
MAPCLRTNGTNSANSPPESMIAAGSVNTQAIARLLTVPHCNPDPFAAIVPAMPEVRMDRQSVHVRRRDRSHRDEFGGGALGVSQVVLPIFSPTVTTIRFQPTIVPRPSAIATATLT